MVFLLLPACQQGVGFQKPDGDDTAAQTGDSYTVPDDTAPPDDDRDNDGYSEAEGDCDDNDVHASPAREEDPGDGVDNDCDGRIDEEFTGLTVVHYDGAGAHLLTVDTIGRETDRLAIQTDECAPLWLDRAGAGWVVNNGYAAVTTVDASGTCVDIGDFSDADLYPFGVYGVVTTPDGTIYATTLDRLFSVGLDGTLTEVATWPCDLAAPATHELAAYSLSVDIETGEIGLFGYFGGFATWTPAGGVVMHATEDLESPVAYTWSGTHRDGGGWFSPGATADGLAILKFNLDTNTWDSIETWEDEDWSPFMLAMDSDEGDYYVTATAGWYATIWRIVHGTGYAADLYVTDGGEPEAFYGIVANYTIGG